jgi:hypothetical protein
MTDTCNGIIMCDNCIHKRFNRNELRTDETYRKMRTVEKGNKVGGYCAGGNHEIYNTLEYCSEFEVVR